MAARAVDPVDEGLVDEAVRGVTPMRHRGLSSPYLTLILTLDEPLSIAAHPDTGDPPGDYVTLLGGLHTSPALIEVPGRQSGVQVALSPLGARALLGLPAGGLAEIGLTPKAAARVVRFDLARRRLAPRPLAPDLAGLAAARLRGSVAPGPRVHGAGRMRTERLAHGGVPKHPSRTQSTRVRLE